MTIGSILLRSSGSSFRRCSTKLSCHCRFESSYVRRKVNLDYDVHSNVSTDLALAPIVVCHGLFSKKKEWTKPCEELNALTKRKVISYDAVNHGGSDHHKSMSYQDMALDLVTILEELNIEKHPICLGHRMGAKTAMTLALAQPERISQVILIDSAPCSRKETLLGDITLSLKAVISINLSKFKTMEEIQDKIANIDIVPLLRESVLDNVIESPDGGFLWTCNFQGVIDNYKEVISFPSFSDEVSFTPPTLFLGNTEKLEHEVPVIMKRFPNADLQHIEECNFNIHKNITTDMLTNISEFLIR